jgi:hypothetical protein
MASVTNGWLGARYDRACVLEQLDRVDRGFQFAGVGDSRELDELRAARFDDEIPAPSASSATATTPAQS